MPLTYGIVYTPQGGPFKDVEICWWKCYATPAIFTSCVDAEKVVTFIKKIAPLSKPHVVTAKMAKEASDNMVAAYRQPGFLRMRSEQPQ